MNCKLKLHAYGFYWKILRALHALEDLEHFFKFSIHLSVRNSREKLQTNIGKILNKSLEKFKLRYAPKMFKYNPLLRSFSLQLIFFSEKLFYWTYLTLDSHTNTVISHTFAYSSRWRRKPWQGLLHFDMDLLKCIFIVQFILGWKEEWAVYWVSQLPPNHLVSVVHHSTICCFADPRSPKKVVLAHKWKSGGSVSLWVTLLNAINWIFKLIIITSLTALNNFELNFLWYIITIK